MVIDDTCIDVTCAFISPKLYLTPNPWIRNNWLEPVMIKKKEFVLFRSKLDLTILTNYLYQFCTVYINSRKFLYRQIWWLCRKFQIRMTLCSSSTKKGRFGPLLLEENDENVLEWSNWRITNRNALSFKVSN